MERLDDLKIEWGMERFNNAHNNFIKIKDIKLSVKEIEDLFENDLDTFTFYHSHALDTMKLKRTKK